MFFKQGNSGWSEVLTMNPATFSTLAAAQKEVVGNGNLVQLRAQLLGFGAQFVGIRLSKFGVWRDSNYTAANSGTPSGNIFAAPGYLNTFPAANPWDALTIRLECGDSYRRLVYLGGVPQYQFAQPVGGPYQQTWGNALNSYFNYLTGKLNFTAGKYGTMVSSKNVADPPSSNIQTAPGQNPTFAVVGGQPQVTLAPSDSTAGITQGQKIRILGVRGQPGLDLRKWNGIFTVVNGQVGKSFTFIAKVTPDQATFAKLDWTQAYLFVPKPQFQAFTDWDFENYTHRKRGVAFGTPRGRVRSQG
jgi:hypothetical protein